MTGKPEVTGKKVKDAVKWMADNCSRCGSVPVGKRIDDGRVTVGYFTQTWCKDRVC
jgi:hypothetical protein